MTGTLRALGLSLALLVLGWPVAARAQVDMELSAPGKVEVGQPFEVKLQALSGEGDPEQARLNAPPGFSVQGPRVGTSWQVGISNGRMTRRTGLNATWVLTAKAPGKYSIGPASVLLGGKTYRSSAQSVEVVPEGSLPRAPRRRSPFGGMFDPFDFDPFGKDPGMPDIDDLLNDTEPPLADYPAELATDAALDSLAFIVAKAQPTRVYLGQQVTFQVIAYGARGPFQEVSAKEASRNDFFSYALVDGTSSVPVQRVPIGDSVWYAAKVRELVLFPLRAGELEIGPMEFGFGGMRYGRSLLRRSRPLQITVAEPPLTDRPAGYQLGDVGRFRLEAQVEPREVQAGGSVSAVVTLSGTGNLPAELRVPTRKGVDFLTPTVRATPRVENGVYGGSKVFTYVIQLSEAGTVELGEIRLPYFDPATEQYQTASVALGQVRVTPVGNAAAAPSSDVPPSSASGLEQLVKSLTPRNELTALPPAEPMLTDRVSNWLLLLAAPLLVLLAQALSSLIRRAGSWLNMRRSAPGVRINQLLREAEYSASSDPAATASAVERALYLALETRFGIKARGLLRPELVTQLQQRSVPEALCRAISDCLEACDGLRFAPDAAAAAAELPKRARKLTAALQARKPGAGEKPAGEGALA